MTYDRLFIEVYIDTDDALSFETRLPSQYSSSILAWLVNFNVSNDAFLIRI